MFKAKGYDLVLVDVNMPVLDGYGAVAAMRAWERRAQSYTNANGRTHRTRDDSG